MRWLDLCLRSLDCGPISQPKLQKQENRITVLEKDIENLKEFKESANRRLDSHDEQNKAILVLAEQGQKHGRRYSRAKTRHYERGVTFMKINWGVRLRNKTFGGH